MTFNSKTLIALITVLIIGFVSGCGGDDQQGNQQNNGNGGNSGQNSSGNSSGGSQSRNVDETVTGRVVRVDLESRRFVVRPQEEGSESVLIRFNPESVDVTSDGEDAAPDAIEEGLTAEVGYVLNDDDNPVARVISLQSGDPGTETVSGRVVRVNTETRRFVIRPQGEDSEPTLIVFNPENVEVTLDGEQAAPDVLQEGQQVNVGYIVNDQDRQVARSVEVVSEGSSAPEETT